MKKLVLGVLLCGLLVACSDDKKPIMVVTPDATMQCNPLLNTGCPANQKCTWLLDALMPNYVGHIGCAPAGTAALGGTCMYGAPGETGYDNCVGGTVCSNFTGSAPGICKQICDQQGGMPACDQDHVCVIYARLFDLGETTPAAAGVCNVGCNPLDDNDFDGSGSDLGRVGTKCPTANEGCYGSPSYGTPPVSGFSCTRDIHYGSATFYGHRTQCVTANSCADAMTMKPYQNSCNQGYQPVLYETTGSTTVICVAFCEPENCFMGNCGSNNESRLGKTRGSGASHRCNAVDRVGLFDGTTTGSDNGEHCQFLWRYEIDTATRTYLASQWSDKLGFCYDHSKYQYDSDEDNMPDTYFPACAQLPDGFGSGSDASIPLEYWGAADVAMACVDSTRLMANGKVQIPEESMKKLQKVDLPRPFYDQSVYER